MKRFRIPFVLGVFLILCSTAFATVPNVMNFQGILRDSSGNPAADSSYSLTFSIYDALTGGTLIWQETQSVSITDGLFNVLLGTLTPIDEAVIDGNARYITVAIGGSPEMTPRTQLVSVPHSLRVATVDGATGGIITGDVSIQSNLNVSDTVQTAAFKMSADAGNGKVLTSDANGAGTWQIPIGSPQLTSSVSGYDNQDDIDSGTVSGRIVTFTKIFESSKLKITYSDNLRVLGVAGQNNGATWEIKLDGLSISNPHSLKTTVEADAGGTTFHNIHRQSTLIGYVLGVPAGIHTVRVDVGPTPLGVRGNAFTGSYSTFLLEVEEIPEP